MPRPPRADEAFGIYHALNRANLRATIFHKEREYLAFEKSLVRDWSGIKLNCCATLSYQLMPNHYHLILRPLVSGELSRFMKWIGGTHSMRNHSHYHTQELLKIDNSQGNGDTQLSQVVSLYPARTKQGQGAQNIDSSIRSMLAF